MTELQQLKEALAVLRSRKTETVEDSKLDEGTLQTAFEVGTGLYLGKAAVEVALGLATIGLLSGAMVAKKAFNAVGSALAKKAKTEEDKKLYLNIQSEVDKLLADTDFLKKFADQKANKTLIGFKAFIVPRKEEYPLLAEIVTSPSVRMGLKGNTMNDIKNKHAVK